MFNRDIAASRPFAPRTLTQAFGPYADRHPIHPMPAPMHPADRIVIRASALALVALVVIFAMEYFA